jgi:3-hydroxymyristoyl/3-hydroxydecanoyl-(acyl carrier protein) dehydratase
MAGMEFVIAPGHPALPGHFPGRPIVPGVVILDQVLAAIESTHGRLGPLRLPQVKFMQPLLPGQVARIVLEEPAATGADTAASRWRFRVECADGPVASGEVATA